MHYVICLDAHDLADYILGSSPREIDSRVYPHLSSASCVRKKPGPDRKSLVAIATLEALCETRKVLLH